MSRTAPRRIIARLAAVLAPALVAALVTALLVAGCTAGGGGIKVTGAWARASSAMASAGAAYMVIENTGTAADALIGASSTVARSTEVHETVDMSSASPAASGMPSPSNGMGGAGSPMPAASGGMGSSGMLGMQPVDRVEIPAGGTLELKPGSYHIMMIGLNRELKAGDSIELTLRFEKAGEVKVTAEVRAS